VFRDLFSGCRINFLLGAGFSCSLLKLLDNFETVMEDIRHFQPDSINERKLKVIAEAYAYWAFFNKSIFPITQDIDKQSEPFLTYSNFALLLKKTTINKQINIFTTNYDPILEIVFDSNKDILYNDGFEGRINPYFCMDNYCKAIYRKSLYSEKKSEIPLVNIFKVHGSVTWNKVNIDNIQYINYKEKIQTFFNQFDICLAKT